MEPETTTKQTSCKSSVMSRIECGDVCPRSRRFFQTRECAVWALWALSIVVGAFAVAVTLFVFTHRQYALYEATHSNFFTFMVDVLPFLWIGVFALMAGVGVYNLRHTKRGYRYPLWQIFASSMVLSLAGGAALQLFGLGYATDHMLGERMGMYDSQDKIEKRMWQNPKEGRLVGVLSAPLVPPATKFEFTDVEGVRWSLSVDDLARHEIELLEKFAPVKLIGIKKGEREASFHPCGVFPFYPDDKVLSRSDMKHAREAFEEKIHSFEERTEAVLGVDDHDERESHESSLCKDAPIMQRLR